MSSEALAAAERNPAVITLVFPTDERIEGVRVMPPAHDSGEPLYAIQFPLADPNF